MLEARNLCKSFDGFKALDGVDMTVPDGCVYGLVGPNGAGKSTVIRHFTGVYRPDSGTVCLNGEPIYENPSVKQHISVINDDFYYFPQAGIKAMAEFYRGIYRNFSQERFEALGRVFDLDLKQPIWRMSKGMQKQAAFWLTMSCMPEYLILDEPVDGLDPIMRRRLWSVLLSDVAERGTTVLVSSHNLRELEDVCDHVGIMNRGKIMLERSLDKLQENTVKLQVAFANPEQVLPRDLDILHESVTGRVRTIILHGSAEEIQAKVSSCAPLFMDVLPLNLEEIFIYELGGADYEIL